MNMQRRYNSVVVPGVVDAMSRDPRVMLAKQALAEGSSTAPVSGWGAGLARIAQGAMGGLANKQAQKRYSGEQDAYMQDVNAKIASVLGGGAPGGATPNMGGSSNPMPSPDLNFSPTVEQGPPSMDLGMGSLARGGPAMGAPQGPGRPMPGATGAPPAGLGQPSMQGGPPPMPGAPPIGDSRGMSADPMNPSAPQAPSVPNSPESIRKRLGLALMGGGNPYSFNQGIGDFYAGLQEDAQNDAVRSEREFGLARDKYGAEVQDFYGARNQKRGAEYDRIGDERKFAQDEKMLRKQFENQWALVRYETNEKDKERAFEQYKFQYEQTGVDPGTYGANPDNIFAALVMQESGGRAGAVGPQTQYGRAYGATQMLPDTARQMAQKLGIPFREDLLRGKSKEAMAYQLRLGRAYFDEGLEKYGGDPAKALAYYHGGPDESIWGPKTRAYVQQVLARTGSVPGAPQATDGSSVFGIQGRSGSNKKALPSKMQTQISSLGDSLDKTLTLAERFNNDYVGYGTNVAGRVANMFTENTGLGNEDRVQWWKEYDSMDNVVRHELFGSALTAGEQSLWERTTITPGTSPKVARKYIDERVAVLRKVAKRQAGSASRVYNPEQIYDLMGGDDTAQRVASYKRLYTEKPASSGTRTGAAAKPTYAPQVINGVRYVHDGKGWVAQGGQGPKPKAPPKRPSTGFPTSAFKGYQQPNILTQRVPQRNGGR